MSENREPAPDEYRLSSLTPLQPIFQPEVAADGIVFAAHSRRREIWVGRSSVQTIVANKFFPGLLDR